MAQQKHAAYEFDKHHKVLMASHQDLKHTVEDTGRLASLNTEFGDRMIA